MGNIDNTWGKQDPCLPTGARTSSAHVGTGKYVECAQAVTTAVGKVYKGNSEAFGKLLRETPFVATGLLALPHSFFNLTAKAPLAALDRVASSLCSDWDDQKIAASVLHEESVWTVDAQNSVTCFLPAFMSSLLSNAFGVSADQSVVEFSQQASDNLSWTLGSCLFDVWGGVLSVHGANTQRHY